MTDTTPRALRALADWLYTRASARHVSDAVDVLRAIADEKEADTARLDAERARAEKAERALEVAVSEVAAAGRREGIATARADDLARKLAAAREALERSERKLSAYVGVCKGDKELTDTVLPMARAALAAIDGGGGK